MMATHVMLSVTQSDFTSSRRSARLSYGNVMATSGEPSSADDVTSDASAIYSLAINVFVKFAVENMLEQ